MKNMNMPGFTAEAALVYAKGHYQAAEEAATYSGTVQPALRHDLGLPCLKFHFVCNGHEPCHWETTVVPISSDLYRIWQDFQRAGAAESSGMM